MADAMDKDVKDEIDWAKLMSIASSHDNEEEKAWILALSGSLLAARLEHHPFSRQVYLEKCAAALRASSAESADEVHHGDAMSFHPPFDAPQLLSQQADAITTTTASASALSSAVAMATPNTTAATVTGDAQDAPIDSFSPALHQS
jgi:hypothetical protein